MLNRYREVEKCKEDIQHFILLVQKEMTDIPESDLTCIIKGMSFIKKVYAFPQKSQEHYYNCLVTDMLGIIHAFSKSSLRVYYTFYRSIIENFVRVILRYENTNATGVRNMFTELRNKYDITDKNFIDYIEGEYGKCCEVIHSNRNANLTMYEYYEEIIAADELDFKKIKELFKQLAGFYNLCKRFIIINDYEQVNESFHNQKEVLYYLIGQKKLQRIFTNYLKKLSVQAPHPGVFFNVIN